MRQPDFVKDTLTEKLARLQALIVTILRGLEDETLKTEIQDMGRRVREARLALADFLSQASGNSVYWIEKSGKSQSFLSLHNAPVDVAACLRPLLFRENQCSILTSATLAVAERRGATPGGLGYFRNRIGADGEEIRALQIGSPFDYERQMKLYITRKMPDPRDAAFEGELAQRIEHFVEMSRRAGLRPLYQPSHPSGAGGETGRAVQESRLEPAGPGPGPAAPPAGR